MTSAELKDALVADDHTAVSLLLEKKKLAEFECDPKGWLHVYVEGCKKANPNILCLLLDAGADPTCKNDGKTALDILIQTQPALSGSEFAELVRRFTDRRSLVACLDLPALCDCRPELLPTVLQFVSLDREARGPLSCLLHYVSKTNKNDCVELLLKKFPAIVDAQAADGNTALHLAVQHGAVESVVSLLLLGADSCINNKNGKSAKALASFRRSGFGAKSEQIADLFEGRGSVFEQMLARQVDRVVPYEAYPVVKPPPLLPLQPPQENAEEAEEADWAIGADTQAMETVADSKGEEVAEKTLNLQVQSGFAESQGVRESMEDAHVTIDDLSPHLKVEEHTKDGKLRSFYAVYDGHGGQETANFLAEILHTNLMEEEDYQNGKILNALESVFAKTDKTVIEKAEEGNWKCGSTAVVVLLDEGKVYVANVGDAEVIVGTHTGDGKYEASLLSQKHNPTVPSEKERIENLGGAVFMGRLFGTLAVSRSFGDRFFKPPSTTENFVSCDPFLSTHTLANNDRFLVIACDGLWDKVTYQDAADIAGKHLEEGKSCAEVARILVDEALQRCTQDNVTVVVVRMVWGEGAAAQPE
eukprot:CAMPEP_0177651808 /NCGR_PEP_ID=MMETSP0447-20121125/12759_1 /TAXON_ID=0 /ORGANISM="Stygamoeba regulata, Strain BSH-02190019" /LENGTH=587 /DNA_ID=CAMNT_0019154941 /DNA_START=76 /DNA_END=1839 /DNA_ORIENTATION=+